MDDIKKRVFFRHIVRDAAIIALGIFFVVFLEKSGAVERFLDLTRGFFPLVSFVAGMFFTSIFTTVFATVVFAEIAQDNSLVLTAVFGGLGAFVGDYIIFRFVRDTLLEDIRGLLQISHADRFAEIFRLQLFRFLAPFFGAVIIASPLPDELGVALLGLSEISTKKFAVFSFLLNATGIVIIGGIARAIA
ncbi:MAG: hypothetical protein A3C12_02685 [Candidatus Sungbacteria bacterium RIFCSPHIGHO2_02_FULL_49_20]|uniref:TVP38/TMEM64 family membrane protein n=1 Tax=Candidatus Sungbacteria bacterium RIFCSPHIGHO2_02_FULL_49_20 TaxID=1802272 RepID=A0A1G2KNI6_9BACT|nr:MAG: hypothetical protein A3C12_02685 [Candidatus Sungbacteria bacterium RIFCSPHIGHO2_02_FULL_49_20]